MVVTLPRAKEEVEIVRHEGIGIYLWQSGHNRHHQNENLEDFEFVSGHRSSVVPKIAALLTPCCRRPERRPKVEATFKKGCLLSLGAPLRCARLRQRGSGDAWASKARLKVDALTTNQISATLFSTPASSQRTYRMR